MDYSQAVAILSNCGQTFEFPLAWGLDLASEHEALSVRAARGAPGGGDELPKDIKAFYMRLNDDGKTVAAMDVLAPGIGEIVGGSQREERLDILDADGVAAERAVVVPGPAPLWHGASCRLRSRF